MLIKNATFVILILLVSCEVQESKNIYTSPAIQVALNINFDSNLYTQEELYKITKLLSKIFNDDVDINNKIDVNFENENISKYIDCGNMNDEIYVDYINRIFGAKLSAIINFEINKTGENFKVTNKDIKYKFMSQETGTRWIFKTNKYKELLVGNPVYDANPYRTCSSKNILEMKIINIFNSSKND